MSDQGPDDNPLDQIIDFSGEQRSLGEKRDYGFKLMRERMIEIKQKQYQRAPPLMRGSMLKAYSEGLTDAFNVFAQVVETSTDEELSPG